MAEHNLIRHGGKYLSATQQAVANLSQAFENAVLQGNKARAQALVNFQVNADYDTSDQAIQEIRRVYKRLGLHITGFGLKK
ncbi:hypothetical protein [Psittacicella hinzii]|uniref:Uncharacterized protein n=1 Tax=Psittacicella hinzii TaxID=2028575 RepID=A0A3A1YAJ3_9GAMM|nr:hypothetical protein [Psittacicella hinzii]RIY35162.1 hypothetical protein CKF58_07005 [Psittacicella hinzii]